MIEVFLKGPITVGFIGRLDPRSLIAMVLGATTFNMSGISLTMGIASGAETVSWEVQAAFGSILESQFYLHPTQE